MTKIGNGPEQSLCRASKAKQAKVYLAIMEFLEEHGSKAGKLIEIPL